MVRAGLVLALVLLVPGCTRWVPARIGDVPVGADVRLRLSDEGIQELEELTGTLRSEISGELVQWDQEVMISAALETSGMRLGNNLRQRLVVDQDDVVGVDVRETDRTRTALFVGGMAVVGGSALVWIISKLTSSGPAAPSQPPTTGPGEPFVRIRIP